MLSVVNLQVCNLGVGMAKTSKSKPFLGKIYRPFQYAGSVFVKRYLSAFKLLHSRAGKQSSWGRIHFVISLLTAFLDDYFYHLGKIYRPHFLYCCIISSVGPLLSPKPDPYHQFVSSKCTRIFGFDHFLCFFFSRLLCFFLVFSPRFILKHWWILEQAHDRFALCPVFELVWVVYRCIMASFSVPLSSGIPVD